MKSNDNNRLVEVGRYQSSIGKIVDFQTATQPKVLVVVPARNEEPSVGGVVRSILAEKKYDVVVINDASEDATAEQARLAGARVINLPYQLGAWGAIQAGMRFALSAGFEHVITMDADGQHLGSELETLHRSIMEQGVDVVIGVCSARVSRSRLMAWRFFSVLTGLNYTDLTSGFRIYNRSALNVLTSLDALMLDYQDLGVLMMLKNKNKVISEIPIEMSIRNHGKSRVFNSYVSVLSYLIYSTLLGISKR